MWTQSVRSLFEDTDTILVYYIQFSYNDRYGIIPTLGSYSL